MGKRRKRSPEEEERRAKIRELLQLSGVSSMADIQDLFKETITEFSHRAPMEEGETGGLIISSQKERQLKLTIL